MSSAVMMPTEFDLYLQPCQRDIDLPLAHVYSPYRKPVWAIDDVILRCSSHISGKSGDGVDVTGTLSSQQVTSSFDEDSKLSQCSTSCNDTNNERSQNTPWVHPMIADDSTSGRCRSRPRDGSATIRQPQGSSPRTILCRGKSLPGLTTSNNADPINDISSRRRHFSVGVKFADQVGENLAMFSIIPSRFDEPHQPITMRNQPLHHCTTWSPHLPTDHLFSSTLSDDDLPATGDSPVMTSPDSLKTGLFSFRMFFDQPIADLKEFQRRLDAQSVCLENVKAIETPGIGRGASSLAVLCTVKVKHPVGANRDGIADFRKLFARLTQDEWQSYADISAHCVNCSSTDRDPMSPTGANWIAADCVDTYSFAVHLQTASTSVLDKRPLLPIGGVKSRQEIGSGGCCCCGRPEARHPAIEFALCYTTDDKSTRWDNNNGENYRITWCYYNSKEY